MSYLIQSALIPLCLCTGYLDAKPVFTLITHQYIYCGFKSKSSYLDAIADLKTKTVFTTGKP